MSIASNHDTQRWEVSQRAINEYLRREYSSIRMLKGQSVDSKELGYLEGALEGAGVGGAR